MWFFKGGICPEEFQLYQIQNGRLLALYLVCRISVRFQQGIWPGKFKNVIDFKKYITQGIMVAIWPRVYVRKRPQFLMMGGLHMFKLHNTFEAHMCKTKLNLLKIEVPVYMFISSTSALSIPIDSYKD